MELVIALIAFVAGVLFGARYSDVIQSLMSKW